MGTTMTILESTAAVAHSAQAVLSERSGPQVSWAPRRRGSRLTLDIAVEVYGQGLDRRMFREETRTRVVSAYGALISIKTEVALDQIILLVCKRNGEQMRCRVVHREIAKGETHIGVVFMTPSPKFWGVAFPPDDWDRTERKRTDTHIC